MWLVQASLVPKRLHIWDSQWTAQTGETASRPFLLNQRWKVSLSLVSQLLDILHSAPPCYFSTSQCNRKPGWTCSEPIQEFREAQSWGETVFVDFNNKNNPLTKAPSVKTCAALNPGRNPGLEPVWVWSTCPPSLEENQAWVSLQTDPALIAAEQFYWRNVNCCWRRLSAAGY